MKRRKTKTILELMAEVRDRSPMGRPVVMPTKKEKNSNRNRQKADLRKEVISYVE